jgi:hypothetical protein
MQSFCEQDFISFLKTCIKNNLVNLLRFNLYVSKDLFEVEIRLNEIFEIILAENVNVKLLLLSRAAIFLENMKNKSNGWLSRLYFLSCDHHFHGLSKR